MKEITLKLNPQQLDLIYRGLLELPGKYTLDLIEELKKQLNSQVEEKKETESKSE